MYSSHSQASKAACRDDLTSVTLMSHHKTQIHVKTLEAIHEHTPTAGEEAMSIDSTTKELEIMKPHETGQ